MKKLFHMLMIAFFAVGLAACSKDGTSTPENVGPPPEDPPGAATTGDLGEGGSADDDDDDDDGGGS